MYTNVYKSNISYENGFPLLSDPWGTCITVKTIHKAGHFFGTLVFFFFLMLSMQWCLAPPTVSGGVQ